MMWHGLGFDKAPYPHCRAVEEGDKESNVSGIIALSFFGRLRLILSGKLHIGVGLRLLDNKVVNAAFTFNILPPNFKVPK